MKKILVPVDSEKPCQKTMDIATEWAKLYNAEVVVLHVNHTHDILSHPYAEIRAERSPEAYDAYMKYSKKLLDTAANIFVNANITTTTELISGDPATVICDYATENNCDIIMMCSHGHSAIRRFLVGGVTTKVVHHADVPVMVIR